MKYILFVLMIFTGISLQAQEDYCTQLSVIRANLVAARARVLAEVAGLERQLAKADEAAVNQRREWRRVEEEYLEYLSTNPQDEAVRETLKAAWNKSWTEYQFAVMNRQVLSYRLGVKYPVVDDLARQLSSVMMQIQFYRCGG